MTDAEKFLLHAKFLVHTNIFQWNSETNYTQENQLAQAGVRLEVEAREWNLNRDGKIAHT